MPYRVRVQRGKVPLTFLVLKKKKKKKNSEEEKKKGTGNPQNRNSKHGGKDVERKEKRNSEERSSILFCSVFVVPPTAVFPF